MGLSMNRLRDHLNEICTFLQSLAEVLCNAVLSALQTSWRHALRFLFDMSLLKVSPDLVSYTSAMSSLEKAKLWQEVLLLFKLSNARELAKQRPESALKTFNVAIRAARLPIALRPLKRLRKRQPKGS